MNKKTAVDKIGEMVLYVNAGAALGFVAGAAISYVLPGEITETILNALGVNFKLEAVEAKRTAYQIADLMATEDAGGVVGAVLYGIKEFGRKAYAAMYGMDNMEVHQQDETHRFDKSI